MDIKQLKAELKKQTDANPEKFYPVQTLKGQGFSRKKCRCGRYFWSIPKDDKLCGDCEGYSFIGKPPVKKPLEFLEVWKLFSNTFKKLGYTPIPRYPVVARWRDDQDFTIAAISNFQPYITSGLVKPPANPLVVNQPSLRFNDIDNVGITGRHFSCHMHMEQFGVFPKGEWDPDKYLSDIIYWLSKIVKLPLKEIKFHEDAWGGGGNLGVSLEYFCRGLELGNQVYMTYKITKNGYTDLPLKVLDMGSGQERYSWLTHGKTSTYDITFPTVCKYIYSIAKIKPDKNLLMKFMALAGTLNIEEVADINKEWEKISKELKISVEKLRKSLEPLFAIYSIADHTRALLFALADGAIPSNTGGGYNLRSIYRRAYDFCQQYKWKINFGKLCELHAKYLKPQYPELVKALPEAKKILISEEKKYKQTLVNAVQVLKTLKGKLDENKLIELYDSKGLTPEFLKKEGKISSIPGDFYSKVAARHEKKVSEVEEEKQVPGAEPTIPLYMGDEKSTQFIAKVLRIIDGLYVVLDKTMFYPLSGGQDCDFGDINGCAVSSVEKWGQHIVHGVERVTFKEGDTVVGRINWPRRYRLMKHHTAVHVINGSARAVLGEHIWQAGSEVNVNKARLDVTHYDNITPLELKEIEKVANETIKKRIKLDKQIYPKDQAEKLFGFRLYQGGAIPGAELRVVNIPGFDVEACGGTHVDNTSEIQEIKIISAKKIQDGVIRLSFVAGEAAREFENSQKSQVEECKAILKCKSGDFEAACKVFSVQPEQLHNTLDRFMREVRQQCEVLKRDFSKVEKEISNKKMEGACQFLFDLWKKQRKELKR